MGLAMIAITAFAAQEFVTHVAIIDETPLFFKPIWTVLSDMQPSYIIPPEETPSIFEAITPALDAAVTTPAEAATSVLPPIDAVTSVVPSFDAAPAASVESFVIPSFDAAPAVPTVPTVPAVSSPVDNEELIFAKKRIAELESKLAVIGGLSR